MQDLRDAFVLRVLDPSDRPLRNRTDVRLKLATILRAAAECQDVVVLELPHGSVPMAYETAAAMARRHFLYQ